MCMPGTPQGTNTLSEKHMNPATYHSSTSQRIPHPATWIQPSGPGSCPPLPVGFPQSPTATHCSHNLYPSAHTVYSAWGATHPSLWVSILSRPSPWVGSPVCQGLVSSQGLTQKEWGTCTILKSPHGSEIYVLPSQFNIWGNWGSEQNWLDQGLVRAPYFFSPVPIRGFCSIPGISQGVVGIEKPHL